MRCAGRREGEALPGGTSYRPRLQPQLSLRTRRQSQPRMSFSRVAGLGGSSENLTRSRLPRNEHFGDACAAMNIENFCTGRGTH